MIHEIYEPLFHYAYEVRPLKLEPVLAKAMPTVSEDLLTYDIELKPSVHFTDDVAFVSSSNPEGKGRALTVEDIVFSIRRVADAKVQSTGWWIFDGRIVGLNEFREQTKNADHETMKKLYQQSIEGLEVLSPNKLRIKLVKPYPQLLYALATNYAVAIAHEVVDYYGQDFMAHPVGTGPFKLKKWRRGAKIVLVKNENYHQEGFPRVDQVNLIVYRESQPMWLNFMLGNIDVTGIPKDEYDNAVVDGELKPELKAKGIMLETQELMDVSFNAFNFKHPVLGKHKKVRQAMSLAYDTKKRLRLFYNDRGIVAQGPIPPGLEGYDPDLRNPYKEYNVEKAKTFVETSGFSRW